MAHKQKRKRKKVPLATKPRLPVSVRFSPAELALIDRLRGSSETRGEYIRRKATERQIELFRD
jgi:hypothetical protein